jgi:drug/metabolite transporter (DMT)-like permease
LIDELLRGSMAVVVLGLLATLGWGVSDFGGGLVSRRAPVLGVLLFSQVAGLLVAIPLAAGVGEPAMTPADVAFALAAGSFGSVGLALLYRGLAVGRMGVVAPVAGVLTAGIPVAVGLLTQGVPSVGAMIGMALAVISVVLVSRAPSAPGGGPNGIGYGLGAGIGFGLFAVSVSQLGPGLAVSPLLVVRSAAIVVVAAIVMLRRQPWRVPRRTLPALVAVGTLDMLATVFYMSAIDVGPLAVAAILASLYPVVTVILAALVLRERVTAIHLFGIVTAGLAIVLIAGASAG